MTDDMSEDLCDGSGAYHHRARLSEASLLACATASHLVRLSELLVGTSGYQGCTLIIISVCAYSLDILFVCGFDFR